MTWRVAARPVITAARSRASRSGAGGIPAGATWTVNQNVEPPPSRLTAPISPPMSSARRREMARPRPVPSRAARLDSAWAKGSNSCSMTAGSTPAPVSVTVSRTIT